jgi:hypothetical protein
MDSFKSAVVKSDVQSAIDGAGFGFPGAAAIACTLLCLIP